MERIFVFSLIAIVAIAMEARNFTYDGVAYTVLDENARTCQVKAGSDLKYPGAIAKGYMGAITLPANPKDDSGQTYTLISIGEYAFYDCSGLKSITIPNSVTWIGRDAFSCCFGLTKAEFASIESLCSFKFNAEGANPLWYAHNLYINGEEIKDLVIPNSVTEIGNYAFCGCSGLTSVTIPTSVTSIGDYAFSDCSGLTSVTIPNSVTIIGESAFIVCRGMTSITIPNSVTRIGDDAFWGCSGLTSVSIPASVTDIGNYAFSGCSGLKSIAIPNSVTWIGWGAFYDCFGLTKAEFASIESLCSIDFGDSYANPLRCAQNLYINGEEIKNLVIPNSVTSIRSSTFRGCSGLTSVSLPEGLTSIGDDSFYGCSGLTSITIPTSVTEIGNYAFSDCSGLTSITIPNSVATLGDKVFSGCKDLKSILIGSGITGINKNVFEGCVNIHKIAKPSTLSLNLDINACVINYDINDVFFAEDGCVYTDDKTKLCFVPITVSETVNIPESVKIIGRGAFVGCTDLPSIQFPASVIEINDYAFSDCSGLTSITIPNSVATLGDKAFSGCTGLKSILIGSGITAINKNVFERCVNIHKIAKPSTFSLNIYNNACIINYDVNDVFFAEDGCVYTDDKTKLCFVPITVSKPVNILESVKIIERGAFLDCSDLPSVRLPASVIVINDEAFSGCTGLTSISLSEGLTSIGDSAFSGCTGLTSISLSEGLTSIGDSAFSDCTGLISISLPNGLATIGTSAFYGCTGLKSVIFPTSLTTIEDNAFNNCTSLISICFPAGLKTIGTNAFARCKFKKVAKSDALVFSFYKSVVVIDYDMYDSRFENGCVYTRNMRKLYYVPTTVNETFELPATVTAIGDYAFAYCDEMPSITMGSAVATIGKNAFEDCSALERVDIPNSATAIGDNAFKNCSALADATIGTGVKTIGENAFDGCAQLAEITIPDATSAIGAEAFKGCTGLKKVSLGMSVSSIGERVWADCADIEIVEYWSENPCTAPRDIFWLSVYDNATLYIPSDCKDRYMEVIPWSFFYDIRESGVQTALESVVAEGVAMPCEEIYTLSGVKINSNRSELKPGVYIMRQGSTVSKIAVR